ncbi:MAG: DUF4230 domain-containing protein [Erysipelotrichaceae bacterium]|nr:DUF4230 domain-containing protein [Erysipelotrichaceae bacterium]
MSEEKNLQEMIENAVKESIKKENRKNRFLSTLIPLIGYALILCSLWFIYDRIRPKTPEIAPVEDHDVTLDNNGILGFTAADFEEAVLGKSQMQQLLIVDEQEVSVTSIITQAGLFNWDITSKTVNETIYGTGTYTVDLSRVTRDSIIFDQDLFTVIIHVPYPELHAVTFNPEKTQIGDTKKGWLAFGEIKLTPEEQKEFETAAITKLTTRLNEQECFDTAVRFARLAAYELYQPVVSAVSPAYKVTIVVDDKE